MIGVDLIWGKRRGMPHMCCRLLRLVSLTGLLLFAALAGPTADARQKVLILVEGTGDLKSYATGDGRHLAMLLGHFDVTTTLLGVDAYRPHTVASYDHVFYVGFHARNTPPRAFLDDVMESSVPVVWLHTGFVEFCSTHDVRRRFGFTVSSIDSLGGFHTIEHNGVTYTKEEPNINVITVVDRAKVRVLANAVSATTRRRIPYIVQSGHLLYVADSPFASISPADRYILFADMLHDILGEDHEESHSAIIRIEDVNPMENPDRLRDIADILSARDIPFLVGVSPFYVNPGEGIRVSLSDKPELVDALKYMVRNGGTLVMHGVTHQYKGVTAADYEFWDESTNGPITGETDEGIRRKLDMGIQELMKNGLYPLIWETPHYTASFRLYRIIAEYFSTAMEQRLAIENAEYSQYFPYIITTDLFGQKLYPENLGYVPLYPDAALSRPYVLEMIRNARANLHVRDGFAASFFHAFVEPSLLEELVDSVRAMGYTYIDVRDDTHWVKTRDRVILTGSQDYSVTLNDQYLTEATYDRAGELVQRVVSDIRESGLVRRTAALAPGELYRAEPTEFKERQQTAVESVLQTVEHALGHVLSGEDPWQEARPVILWNQYVRGAAYNDQASLAAAFGAVSIPVDTIFVGQPIDCSRNNLLIVPYSFVDSLGLHDYDAIVRWVKDGGHLITDRRNYLIEEFGIRFSTTSLKVNRVIDRLFPEERIVWRYTELLNKFEADDVDEVFCVDNATDAPLVIGKAFGKGRIIFIATRFDPHTQLGISHYPYLMEYVRKYLGLRPVVRRDALEMYFDPGFRHTQSIEYLIQLWVRQGIRRIHVAGWHTYPKYTYDYERLITLAHANGILVYAWLEPPQVSQKFWLEHPQWREKNIRDDDVRPSWRYPMALTDPRCVQSVVDVYRTFLTAYDWDGVNLAELYFEAGKGFENPDLFTPMHPTARADVRAHYGIDLAEVFDARSAVYWKTHPSVRETVTRYRVSMLDRVYRLLLQTFRSVQEQRSGFEVIVTAMDSFGSPELRDELGVDMGSILALQKEFGFALQVEDPERRWSTDPLRYVNIGARYAGLLDDSSKLLLDLNILSFRNPDVLTPFPTPIQTGTESFHLVRSSSVGAPRATIYAESSVNPQDMIFLAHANAGKVLVTHDGDDFLASSPVEWALRLPGVVSEVNLDGYPLAPVRDNIFVIPAGEHRITPTRSLSTQQFYPRIMSITGTLLSFRYDMRTVSLEYVSDGRCLLSLNSEPQQLTVDDKRHEFSVMKGNDCYTIFLPAGHHRVVLVAGDPFSYGVHITSFWSTTAIAYFGLAAVGILLLMYGVVRVRRRYLTPAGRWIAP